MESLFRSASVSGEFLVVRALAGFKVFSALGFRDDLVGLSAGCRVRLLNLPQELCGGVQAPEDHHHATYVPLVEGENFGFGFVLDGSSVVVDVEDLSKDQVLQVLPVQE